MFHFNWYLDIKKFRNWQAILHKVENYKCFNTAM